MRLAFGQVCVHSFYFLVLNFLGLECVPLRGCKGTFPRCKKRWGKNCLLVDAHLAYTILHQLLLILVEVLVRHLLVCSVFKHAEIVIESEQAIAPLRIIQRLVCQNLILDPAPLLS